MKTTYEKKKFGTDEYWFVQQYEVSSNVLMIELGRHFLIIKCGTERLQI